MITLYNFGPIGDVSDPSPFCVKVETYLRMLELPYETKSGAKYLRQAPKGKLPFIEDNGKIIADSAIILTYLKSTYGDLLDAALSTPDKAISHAFSTLIDEHLYWVVGYARWLLPENSAALEGYFFNTLPFPVNKLVALVASRKVRHALYQQGVGRHSEAEIFDLGTRDLTALSDLLGSKPYFFGEQPTTLDAVAYGMLVQMIRVPVFTAPIFEKAKSYQNLVAFTDRMHARYFSEQHPG